MSAVLPSSAAASSAASNTAASADDKPKTVTTALERLALSREQLRAAMLPKPKTTDSGHSGGIAAYASKLTDRVKEVPGANVLLDAVQVWWAKHPLHTAGLVAAEASRKFAAPIAERRPMTLIFGAVLLGAILALSRPWRWLLRPALFAGLVPALIARAMKELPVDSLLRMFGSGPDRSAVKTPGAYPSAPVSQVVPGSTGVTSAATSSATPSAGVASTPGMSSSPSASTSPSAERMTAGEFPVPPQSRAGADGKWSAAATTH